MSAASCGPRRCREAFRWHAAGELSAEAFTGVQNAAIRDVVRLQEEAGLKVVTDGEFRRSSYWGRFVERCSGFVIKPAEFKFRDDHGHEVDFTATYATAKLAAQPAARHRRVRLPGPVTKVTPKITMPRPPPCTSTAAATSPTARRTPTPSTFFADLARIYREEIADLAKAGCRYIQLDEVAVAMLCDPAIREKIAGAGQDPDRLVDLYIKGINDCVAGAPATWLSASTCAGATSAAAISRKAATSRSPSASSPTPRPPTSCWSTTRRARATSSRCASCPRARAWCSGSSAPTPVLETIDDLKRRTGEAAKFIDLDRLGLGPQCGFASTAAGNPLTEDDERAKLGLIVEAAGAIWGWSSRAPRADRTVMSTLWSYRFVAKAIYVAAPSIIGRISRRRNAPQCRPPWTQWSEPSASQFRWLSYDFGRLLLR